MLYFTFAALLTFKPPLKMEARTHLQLGQILQQYTNNMDLARHHLETAVRFLLSISIEILLIAGSTF